MYYYSEVLRGMRALRVIGIILGVLLVIAIIFRVWAFAEHKHSPDVMALALQSSPTAHVTTKTLADGTIETTVNDPFKRIHAVIDRRGRLFHMDATMPSSETMSHNSFSMGNSSIDENQKAGTKHVVVTQDMTANIPVGILFAIGAIFALVTATMLAGVLAKENDGHLEVVWTKPVSRERLALASIATDMATIIVSQFAAVAVILLACAMFVWPQFYTNALTASAVALALLGPIAWYACLTAFSASLKRGLGMVVGLGWLAALVIPAVAQATARSQSDLGRTLHVVFQSLAYIDPIAYLSFHGTLTSTGAQLQTAIGPIGSSALVLLLLTIVYTALAVLQWRRVEA